MNKPTAKIQPKSLTLKGAIVLGVGFFVNVVFMTIGIGGLLRELSRLAVIVGFFMIIVGLVLKMLHGKIDK